VVVSHLFSTKTNLSLDLKARRKVLAVIWFLCCGVVPSYRPLCVVGRAKISEQPAKPAQWPVAGTFRNRMVLMICSGHVDFAQWARGF
jgi:hypothetical protein